MKKLTSSFFAGLAVLATAGAAQAQTPAEFYKGKTVTIFIGFSPGGTYDLFGRMVARHIGKHIPGNPNVIGSNMPGAGGLTATNFMFRAAPKDGTAMAISTQNIAIEEALKNKAVQYKSNEFNWIGRATSNIEIHVLSTKSPGHTIEGAKKHETPVASTGPGSPSDSYPRLLNATLGTKYKVIRGFPGSTDGLLAIERGEVDGALTSWNTMKSTRMNWLTEGRAVLPIQYVLKRSPELKDVPTPHRARHQRGRPQAAHLRDFERGSRPCVPRPSGCAGRPREGAARGVRRDDEGQGSARRSAEGAARFRAGDRRGDGQDHRRYARRRRSDDRAHAQDHDRRLSTAQS